MNKKNNNNVRRNGWKQGSCLRVDDLGTFKKPLPLGSGLYVVLSQTCDVVHDDLEKEPSVELLLLEKIDKPDNNYICGRNPRTLHFTHSDSGVNYQCLAKNRDILPREYLQETSPDQELLLGGESLELLIDWIIKRYKRAAFPDEFNKRIDKKTIRGLLKKHFKDIEGLYIRLIPEDKELRKEEIYELDLYVLIEPEYYENRCLDGIENTTEEIKSLIEKNKDIKVMSYYVRSLDDISVHEYRQLKKWDFDDLSVVGME